jgi:two-component system OmpR family sensor kinase
MISLRRSALIWMTVLLAAVGVVAFLIAYKIAESEAADFLDGQLRQIALNAGGGPGDLSEPEVKVDPEDEFAIEIWDTAGASLRKSSNDVILPRQSATGFTTIRFRDELWRVHQISGRHQTVQVGQRMRVREEMAEAAAIQAGIPILIAIPLAWLVVGWSLGQMLARLARLAQDIAQRGTDRKDPIPSEGVPIEVLPLIKAMNSLVVRLQTAVEQQQQFVSDAAHELRTPLAALQIQIDNLYAWTGGERSGPAFEFRAGVRRASALVDQLLRMARLQEH